MATRRETGLRQGVGLRLIASVIFVNLAAAVFVSLGVVADEALGLTPLVFVVAGLVFLLTLLGYVEGIAMLPQAGGAAGFARRGLGELSSFLAGWALVLDYLILVVLTASFAVHYLGSIVGLDVLLWRPWDHLVAGVFVLAVAALSLRGVRAGTRASIAVALVSLGAQLLLAALGFALVNDPGSIVASIDLGATPTWAALAFALPVAMIGFTGLDSVANLGEELESPGSNIPRPLIWSAVVSVLVFVTMSAVALNAQPVVGAGELATTPLGTAAGYVDRPVVGIIDALDVPGVVTGSLLVLFGLLAAAVLFLAASTAMSGVARVAYSMSRHRQAPSALFRIDRATGVPRVAVVLVALLSLAVLAMTAAVADSAVELAQLYAFGATFTSTVAGVAVMRMRFCEPDLPRPFRAPLNVDVGSGSMSLLTLAGTLGSFAMFVLVIATHDAARVLGIVWMVVGFVLYGTYRLTHGLPLARRAELRTVEPPRIDARSYSRVLVAVRPERGMLFGAGDAELVGLAHKLLDGPYVAGDDPAARRDVAVMLVHELPLTLALDAPLGDVERATMKRLSMIRSVATTLDLRVSSSVARARAAGRAICQEAQRRDSDAVLLAIRTKRRKGDEAFGKCVSYVLRHAPCDVVVLSLPEESLRSATSPRSGE